MRKTLLLSSLVLINGCSFIKQPIQERMDTLSECEMETFLNSFLKPKYKKIIINKKCKADERNKKLSFSNRIKSFFQENESERFKKSIPPHVYTFASRNLAHDHGKVIDIEKENHQVSRVLLALKEEKIKDHILLIVPGHASDKQKEDTPLDKTTLKRLEIAHRIYKRDNYAAILVSGGNIHPKGTPHNEAYEMKKYLMKNYKVPEYRIAIEPFARNSVTNLRNAGRFMLSHGIEKSLIVTTNAQNYYYAFSNVSSLDSRSIKLLGYKVGNFKLLEKNATEFKVSKSVLGVGKDPLDP